MEVKISTQALSINRAFQGRRFKTNLYKTYEQIMLTLLPKQPIVKGWVEVWYEFGLTAKSFGISDVGNLEKLLSDILVKKGYIEDDRKILDLHLKKVLYSNYYIKIKICPIKT